MNRREMLQMLTVLIATKALAIPEKKRMKHTYDVVIIGGGPAGLTSALALGRGGRSVLVLDEGNGRNAPAAHMQNFPSRDGTPPEEFKAQIRDDLKKYEEVKIEKTKVFSLDKADEKFLVNGLYVAKKIILAHGVRDILLPIPGMRELWGKSIFHCPYCHGYEFKNQKLGLLADEKTAEHMIPLLKGLSPDVIHFQMGSVESFVYEGTKLKAVKLTNGETVARDALLFKPAQEFTSDLGVKLGCEKTELGFYKVDDNGLTTVPGVYAAGDITEMRQGVLFACASGMKAAVMANYSILAGT
jgi:thioredoxin reductase